MSFNLAALMSRVQSVAVTAPAPVVQGLASIRRKDAARNPRTLQSIIEESGELESFDASEEFDNEQFIARAED